MNSRQTRCHEVTDKKYKVTKYHPVEHYKEIIKSKYNNMTPETNLFIAINQDHTLSDNIIYACIEDKQRHLRQPLSKFSSHNIQSRKQLE